LFARVERFLDALIPPSDEVLTMVKRGEALLAAGEPESSLRFAENALAVAPLFLRGLQLRADSLFALGDAAHALAVLTDAAAERAMPAFSFACMCEYAATAGAVSRATELATHARSLVRERDPHVAKRLVRASRALIAQKQYSAALLIARGATAVDPKLGDAWVILARDALLRGDLSQCARALNRAVGRSARSTATATATTAGTDAPAHTTDAAPSSALVNTASPQPAAASTQSDPIDPTDAALNREIGEIALAIGDCELAAKHLRRAWVCGDSDSVAPLVVALWRLGDQSGIVRVFSDAEGSHAQMAKALFALETGGDAAGLASVVGAEIPDALWPLAVESALQSAPLVAERWALEAPNRPASSAIASLKQARLAMESGQPAQARTLLEAALSDERTRTFARRMYVQACEQSWRGQLASQLEELAVMVGAEPDLSTMEQELRSLRRELDAPLRVALLGEFSAGKSTFLNAMVGAKVSPMGVLPTTAQVHWLRFGDAGARVVDRRGTSVLCTIDEAPRVVERMRSSDLNASVDYVEVTWPAARLARIELIDTPGFNAGDASHERAVRSAFAMADVALWLFDARQAGKSSETTPLEEARAADLPVLGVLNKIDMVASGELHSVVRVVAEGFAELAPLVMTVSTREGLAAQLVLEDPQSDENAKSLAKTKLVSSGFASLLTYLDQHLVHLRLQWKQLRVARRALQWVNKAEALLSDAERSVSRKEQRRDSLLAAIAVFRESLPALLQAARQEVATALGSQMKGLDSRRVRGVDADELALDAAAEVRWRVRERFANLLAPSLLELERLAVGAGVVPQESALLVSATTLQALDEAVRAGVTDAQTERVSRAAQLSATASALGYDPFSALEQAVARSDHHDLERTTLVRMALAVAREQLAHYTRPVVPVLEHSVRIDR
jgi:tetratricopeptide (TPR) repeat protein/GTPase SAR1 family protein